MKPERIVLPWPNSDNNHHKPIPGRKRGGGFCGRMILTDDAKRYRELVKMLLGFRHPDRRWSCPLRIDIELYPPRVSCDTNNYWKSLQDALTHAGVWVDDNLVAESHAVRRRREKNVSPFVIVNIEEIVGGA